MDPYDSTKFKLKENLKTYFSEIDIRELCFDLGIDYEELPGTSKREKIFGLITYTQNRGQFQELFAYSKNLRPNAKW